MLVHELLSEAKNDVMVDINKIDDLQGVISGSGVDKYVKMIVDGDEDKITAVILIPYSTQDAKRTKKDYWIYDGSHRFNAFVKAGRDKVPAAIASSEDDADMIQMRQQEQEAPAFWWKK